MNIWGGLLIDWLERKAMKYYGAQLFIIASIIEKVIKTIFIIKRYSQGGQIHFIHFIWISSENLYQTIIYCILNYKKFEAANGGSSSSIEKR